ncbi:MAG: hypothetical protein KIG39_05505 [Lachnospiraceae bacterium]|nr:hypothetical protein [Lachnospiraceae bacterium]
MSVKTDLEQNAKRVIMNTEGDQITGWLIVVLMVVVVGAFFMNTYQTTITDIWTRIVQKIYTTFGI